jgi:hypothetical protein
MPAFSGVDHLRDIPHHPDPFLNMDGTRVDPNDGPLSTGWRCRREEISQLVQHYELGVKPPKPATVTASIQHSDAADSIRVTVGGGGRRGNTSIEFDSSFVLPSKGSAPYPMIISVGRGWGGTVSAGSLNTTRMLELGVGVIAFDNNDLGDQRGASSRGVGKYFDFYPPSDENEYNDASAMVAWAWGVSRLIDAIESTPAAAAIIDTKRLGATGCSRNGKGALTVGALDERIALTIVQESGSGGAASWRLSDWTDGAPAGLTPTTYGNGSIHRTCQTLQEITGENVWFRESFSDFNHHATKLPYDHHALQALVAPRGLLSIENSIDWLGPESTYGCDVLAHEVYCMLGVGESMGGWALGEHGHCAFPAAQQLAVDAFVQKFLLGNESVDTHFVQTDGHGTFKASFTFDNRNFSTWAPWAGQNSWWPPLSSYNHATGGAHADPAPSGHGGHGTMALLVVLVVVVVGVGAVCFKKTEAKNTSPRKEVLLEENEEPN